MSHPSGPGRRARVLVVQHLPHEHSGVLGEVLELRGADVRLVRAWTGQPVPTAARGHDAVVVLGGDMDTDQDDRWPHLRDARALLADAVATGVPALGICLGAQLLAEATGGSVHHGRPEVGYVPVRHTPSGRAHPVIGAVADGTPLFNAHRDHITAPPGATLLAYSDDVAVHAFAVGTGLGLQHHPEFDASMVAGYVEVDGVAEHLAAAGWRAEALLAEARRRNAAHRAAGAAVFGVWLDAVTAGLSTTP